MLLPIASVVVVGVAACAALGLLIVLFVRLSQRLEAMTVDVERIDRVLKDSAADVRSRLEESAREVEVMAAAVGKVESVEAEVGSLKTSFETHAPVFETVGSRIDAIESRVASLDERINEVEKLGTEGMAAVRAEWNEVEAMIEKSERQLAEVEAERTREADRLEELRTRSRSRRTASRRSSRTRSRRSRTPPRASTRSRARSKTSRSWRPPRSSLHAHPHARKTSPRRSRSGIPLV